MKNRPILTPFFLNKFDPGLKSLSKPDWQVNEPLSLPDGEVQAKMSAIHAPLAELVSKAVLNHERPISIAGDCCTAIAVLAGLQRAGINPLLIWFDAHGDFNTWETTPSGFLGGMPLAMLVGKGEQTMPQAVELKSQPENKVILTDARDLDPGEKQLIEISGLRLMKKIDELLDFQFTDEPIYVHFDTDIVTADESPAQNYPVKGGPSAEMIRAVFDRLSQTGKVVAVSLSAWNPKLDKDQQSEKVSMSLLETLVGEI